MRLKKLVLDFSKKNLVYWRFLTEKGYRKWWRPITWPKSAWLGPFFIKWELEPRIRERWVVMRKPFFAGDVLEPVEIFEERRVADSWIADQKHQFRGPEQYYTVVVAG